MIGAATKELVDLFTQLDVVLNEQLDPLVEKFQASAPAFYNEYKQARVIIDSAATHESQPNVPATNTVPTARATTALSKVA